MQYKLDYYLHQAYTPPYYQREFENDIPENKESIASRTVHIALPFLSLYQPFGKALSLSMGSVRVLYSGSGIFTADNLRDSSYQVMQLGLASLALVGTVYNFTLGLLLTTGADFLSNLILILQKLYEQQYTEAGEETLQALSNSVYLAIMVTGSLEVILISILIQGFISFYHARKEWSKGRMPEAMAKTLMGMIRLYQAHEQFGNIQRRNELYRRYEEIFGRIQNGRKIDHLWDHPAIKASSGEHPLENLAEKIDEQRAILVDAEGNAYDFGSHFWGFGKQTVKGMNVTFRKKENQTTLDFKINLVFRDRLQDLIDNLESSSKADQEDFFRLFGSHIQGIEIAKLPVQETQDDWWSWNLLGDKYEITLKGLGKITIGASDDVHSLYDRVVVEMDKSKSLYDFHEALALFNLDDALRFSAKEDIDRMKMGHLFHMFAPRAATIFERNDLFFDLPLDEFRKEIIRRSPEMAETFDKWLPKMELHEILPGRMRWSLNGLSDELKKYGARGLTATLTGAWWSDEEVKRRTVNILKMGMIAQELRDNSFLNQGGYNGDFQYIVGGSDSVFTQIVTDKNKSFDKNNYQSEVRFLFSPKVFETGTYQYHDDNLGTRSLENSWWNWGRDGYLDRPNIFDFTELERIAFNGDNEVMVKERIPPK